MSGSLHQAGRSLVRSPGYALAVILTLALGIGGAAAVTSVLRSVLLRPLPSAPADRVMSLFESDSLGNIRPISYPTFRDLRAAAPHTFEALAFARGLGAVLKGDGGAERLTAAYVTSDFFRALPAPAALGDAGAAGRVAAVRPTARTADGSASAGRERRRCDGSRSA